MAIHTTAGTDEQYAVFGVGTEVFGLDIGLIESLIPTPPIRPIPGAPDHVVGVTSLRGRAVPVISLRRRLERPDASAEEADQRIIVVVLDGQAIGLLVDSVSEVIEIAPERIQPPSPVLGPEAMRYVSGVAQDGERLIVLLNAAELLSGDEQAALRRVAEAGAPEAAA